MEHKQIESENGITHYWIAKSHNPLEKCIVFTHGLTANHSMFEKQIEQFFPTNTVITWDVPLHGLSRPYQNFSYAHSATELNHILKKESICKTVLLGMSMGGYVCQMFADMFPDMTEGFIALDTTPFGTQYYSKSDLWWLRQVEPMAKWFPDSMLRKSMAKSVSKTTYSYQKMMEMLKPLNKAQMIEQLGAAYGVFAVENRDMTFHFPVLILLGDNDRTGKVKEYSEKWAKETGYPLHIIQNAAHFSNGDNPDQVNEEIATFILSIIAKA